MLYAAGGRLELFRPSLSLMFLAWTLDLMHGPRLAVTRSTSLLELACATPADCSRVWQIFGTSGAAQNAATGCGMCS